MGAIAKKPVSLAFDPSKGRKGLQALSRKAARLQESGKADSVVLPVAAVAGLAEMIEDAMDAATVRARAGQPTVPHEVVVAVHEGTHPVRAWRKYRGLTLQQVADRADMPVGYLSEIETAKKPGSVDAYKALAKALDADISVLIP